MSRGAKKILPNPICAVLHRSQQRNVLGVTDFEQEKARRLRGHWRATYTNSEVIVMEQTRFFQLDINETDHGATLEQDGRMVEIGADQISGVITALQRVAAKHRSDVARRFIDQMKGELAGKASIHPVGGNGKGPKGAA